MSDPVINEPNVPKKFSDLCKYPNANLDPIDLDSVEFHGECRPGLVHEFLVANVHKINYLSWNYESIEDIPHEFRKYVHALNAKCFYQPELKLDQFPNLRCLNLPDLKGNPTIDFTGLTQFKFLAVDSKNASSTLTVNLPPTVDSIIVKNCGVTFLNQDFSEVIDLRLFHYKNLLKFHQNTLALSFPKLRSLVWLGLNHDPMLIVPSLKLMLVLTLVETLPPNVHRVQFTGSQQFVPPSWPSGITYLLTACCTNLPDTLTDLRLSCSTPELFRVPPLVKTLRLPGFHRKLFESCANLEEFGLEGAAHQTPLEDLGYDFGTMTNLKVLSMMNYPVKKILVRASVEKIIIVNCGLESIDIPTLVKSVELRDNQLTAVPVGKEHVKLLLIDLYNNPLKGIGLGFFLPNLEEIYIGPLNRPPEIMLYSEANLRQALHGVIKARHFSIPPTLKKFCYHGPIQTMEYNNANIIKLGTVRLMKNQRVGGQGDEYTYHPDTTTLDLEVVSHNPSLFSFPPLIEAQIFYALPPLDFLSDMLVQCLIRYLRLRLNVWPDFATPLRIPPLVESLTLIWEYNKPPYNQPQTEIPVIECVGEKPRLRELFIDATHDMVDFMGSQPEVVYVNGRRIF